MNVWLVEIDALDGSNNPTTLRYTSGLGMTTLPTDTPANTWFEPRVYASDVGLIERTMFSKASTYGANSIGYGKLTLVNKDGKLDYLLNYSFDGREVRIWYGVEGGAFPSTFTLACKAKAEFLTFDISYVYVTCLDRLADLDKPLCQGMFLGNNTAPNGIEGASNMTNVRKPRVYGSVSNISPLLVNASKLIYCIGANQAPVSATYDRGVSLTKGTDYVSDADMEANAPAASNFRVWSTSTGTYIRLGSNPTGTVTCDAATSTTSAASLIQQVLLDMGIASGDINSSDVTALNTLNSAPVGVYADKDVTALDTANSLAASIGGWVGVDKTNVFRMGRLDAPSGSPVASLDNTSIITCQIVATNTDADRGIPSYQVQLNYNKCWTTQNDLAGSVPPDRIAFTSVDFRQATQTNSTVLTNHPLSTAMVADSYLQNSSDANTESSRRLALYGVQRRLYEIEARLDPATISAIDLGLCVNITYYRFNLSSTLLRIVLISVDSVANRVKIRVWG